VNITPSIRRNWLALILFLVITCLAAALRLYRLDALPPGLYHDEAYNGLDALALLHGEPRPLFHEVWEQVTFAGKVDTLPHGRFPLFFVGNYGREPLFYYLLALSLAVAGARPLAIRLVPALIGILVVPAVYWLARELLGGDDAARGRRVALLAALSVATWYWPVHFSRFGIRPMLLPLVAALTFASLLRGLRTGRRLAWAAGGFWLGLSFYTYTPARMLPLAVLGWLAVVAWVERDFLRRRWREWAIFVIIAAAVAAPLAAFLIRYPEWIWFRAQYVATDAVGVEVQSLGEMLAGNVGLISRGFFLVGEKHLRHNLPGRPMLDPVQAMWFLLGLFITVARVARGLTQDATRNTQHTSRLTFYVPLLVWLLVMLLPTYLTSDAPHFGRAIGITPAVAVLMALGMDGLWTWARRQRWATWAVGLAAGAMPAGRESHAVTYLIRPGDGTALSLLRRWLPQGGVVEAGPHFTVYRVPAAGRRVEPSTPLAANWANKIALLGYDLPDGPFCPGESVPVTVYWRALDEMDLPYTFFVHLLGPFNLATNGPLWDQHDAQPGDGTYPTAAWDTGEIVVDEYVVPIPTEAPPGEYELEVGFYYLPTLERLPVVDEAGQPIGDRVLLEEIHTYPSEKN